MSNIFGIEKQMRPVRSLQMPFKMCKEGWWSSGSLFLLSPMMIATRFPVSSAKVAGLIPGGAIRLPGVYLWLFKITLVDSGDKKYRFRRSMSLSSVFVFFPLRPVGSLVAPAAILAYGHPPGSRASITPPATFNYIYENVGYREKSESALLCT